MKNFVSNTTASGANQFFFASVPGEQHTCRVFYRIKVAGTYEYSLLFTNSLDSTYALGDVGKANLPCLPWVIHSLEAAPCDGVTDGELPFVTLAQNVTVTDTYQTPPVELSPQHYLCLQMTFSGELLPYHEETLLPILERTPEGWIPTKKMPLPGLLGVRRQVKGRIGYVGDSITQGIGTPMDSYTHWSALVADKLGDSYAHWNLGIGYARAHDLATMGGWMDKAMENDIIILCLGTNDILQGYPEEGIKADLRLLVDTFLAAGKRVILQAVPPFAYGPQRLAVWERVNAFLRKEVAPKAELYFEPASVLTSDGSTPLYESHPDETGCALWADALFPEIQKLL